MVRKTTKTTKKKQLEEAQVEVQLVEEEIPIEEVPVAVKKRWNINRYWVILGAGISSIVIGLLIGSLWLAAPDQLWLGIITIALLIGGFIVIKRQFSKRHDIRHNTEVNISDSPGTDNKQIRKNGVEPNSLNIYAKMDEDVGKIIPTEIVFQHVYKPVGQPQQCLNLRKSFFVHIWDIKSGKLIPFILPDRKFTDPSILARYLGLPAQRKYLRNRDSLMQYVGPGLLAAGVIGGFIAIIALTG